MLSLVSYQLWRRRSTFVVRPPHPVHPPPSLRASAFSIFFPHLSLSLRTPPPPSCCRPHLPPDRACIVDGGRTLRSRGRPALDTSLPLSRRQPHRAPCPNTAASVLLLSRLLPRYPPSRPPPPLRLPSSSPRDAGVLPSLPLLTAPPLIRFHKPRDPCAPPYPLGPPTAGMYAHRCISRIQAMAGDTDAPSASGTARPQHEAPAVGSYHSTPSCRPVGFSGFAVGGHPPTALSLPRQVASLVARPFIC
jgi:hypothetical protein